MAESSQQLRRSTFAIFLQCIVSVQAPIILQKMPKAVYVQFYDEVKGKLVIPCWKVGGLDAGVYPVVPVHAEWFLDKGRAHPMLGVKRYQLPLSPAFAITAHASQGQTLKAAIVDMQIGKGTSPIASYVAMTRVKRRHDLLIYRCFERSLFNGGQLKGPTLLLKLLRGEHIDWKKSRRSICPKASATIVVLCNLNKIIAFLNGAAKKNVGVLNVSKQKLQRELLFSADFVTSGNLKQLSARIQNVNGCIDVVLIASRKENAKENASENCRKVVSLRKNGRKRII